MDIPPKHVWHIFTAFIDLRFIGCGLDLANVAMLCMTSRCFAVDWCFCSFQCVLCYNPICTLHILFSIWFTCRPSVENYSWLWQCVAFRNLHWGRTAYLGSRSLWSTTAWFVIAQLSNVISPLVAFQRVATCHPLSILFIAQVIFSVVPSNLATWSSQFFIHSLIFAEA